MQETQTEAIEDTEYKKIIHSLYDTGRNILNNIHNENITTNGIKYHKQYRHLRTSLRNAVEKFPDIDHKIWREALHKGLMARTSTARLSNNSDKVEAVEKVKKVILQDVSEILENPITKEEEEEDRQRKWHDKFYFSGRDFGRAVLQGKFPTKQKHNGIKNLLDAAKRDTPNIAPNTWKDLWFYRACCASKKNTEDFCNQNTGIINAIDSIFATAQTEYEKRKNNKPSTSHTTHDNAIFATQAPCETHSTLSFFSEGVVHSGIGAPSTKKHHLQMEQIGDTASQVTEPQRKRPRKDPHPQKIPQEHCHNVNF